MRVDMTHMRTAVLSILLIYSAILMRVQVMLIQLFQYFFVGNCIFRKLHNLTLSYLKTENQWSLKQEEMNHMSTVTVRLQSGMKVYASAAVSFCHVYFIYQFPRRNEQLFIVCFVPKYTLFLSRKYSKMPLISMILIDFLHVCKYLVSQFDCFTQSKNQLMHQSGVLTLIQTTQFIDDCVLVKS